MAKRNPDICPYCGHEILDDDQEYCDYCGMEIEKEEVPDKKPTGSGFSSMGVTLFIILLLVFLFVKK